MKKQNFKTRLSLQKRIVSSLNATEIAGGAVRSGNFACTRTNKQNCATELTYTECVVCNTWYC